MDESRFTTTFCFAMRSAPRASVTVVIIGSSSGVRPTASATAKRKLSSVRPLAQDFHQHHEQHEETGEAENQHAEGMHAALEGGGRGATRQRRGDGAELRRGARRGDEERRAAPQRGSCRQKAR